MSFRSRDMNVEQEIAAFMDRNYYDKYFLYYDRKKDAESQLSGIDVIANHISHGRLIIDDKAATHYINQDLPTFAFEINFLRYGSRVDGWFYDINKPTSHYNLQWLKADTSDVWNLKERDIKEVHSLLIPRKAIQDYIQNQGFSRNRIEQISEELNRSKHNGPFQIGHPKIKLFRSARLSEAPINLIVPKTILSQLSILDITIR